MKEVFEIDKSWTLFLDRDGVINEKLDNTYVKNWSEFSFLNGSLEAISKLSKVFGKIFIVTNQRGIGKGLMTEQDLIFIHTAMIDVINSNSGRIDKIYYCPEIRDVAFCRKPNIGMAMKAKSDFPEINFEKSVIIGDSPSDIEFGERLKMKKVFIGEWKCQFIGSVDFICSNLLDASTKFTQT